MDISNELKFKKGFPNVSSKFVMLNLNVFDRIITYNLKPGFKESFGFAVSFKRK